MALTEAELMQTAGKGLRVLPFTIDDIPFGKSLTDAEGWGYTTTDWKRLTRLEPDGAFKATIDGKDVGTTACIAFDKVAWIHSVVVRKEFRGLGIGDSLIQACLSFLSRRGIPCVKLDSNPGVEPFYERVGFQREFLSVRYVGQGREFQTRARTLGPGDYENVFAFDRMWTGLDRRRVLNAIFEDFPQSGFVVRDRERTLGYLVVRKGPPWNSVGPCVTRGADSAVAKELLQAVLNSAPGEDFHVCVGDFNRASCALLERLGFKRESHCTRMFLGKRFEESETTFAMISAQKG